MPEVRRKTKLTVRSERFEAAPRSCALPNLAKAVSPPRELRSRLSWFTFLYSLTSCASGQASNWMGFRYCPSPISTRPPADAHSRNNPRSLSPLLVLDWSTCVWEESGLLRNPVTANDSPPGTCGPCDVFESDLDVLNYDAAVRPPAGQMHENMGLPIFRPSRRTRNNVSGSLMCTESPNNHPIMVFLGVVNSETTEVKRRAMITPGKTRKRSSSAMTASGITSLF